MTDRRVWLLSAFGAALAGRTFAQGGDSNAPPGKIEMLIGRPGIVIGVPHGTSDSGTLDAGRLIRDRLKAGAVVATGYWDKTTRRRINVNRPTEQILGKESQPLKQWSSDAAIAANSRYEEAVKQVAQGPLRFFCELHSNHRPEYASSITVSTAGFTRDDAAKLKRAFESARDRLSAELPRLTIQVSPLDRVIYPNYRNASSISAFSERGCAIEHPGTIYDNTVRRRQYALCLAEAIEAARFV